MDHGPPGTSPKIRDPAVPAKVDRAASRVARFGRDIVVIIVGVLIALGFDSWSGTRADRRLEQEYLHRLERDLRADSAMLAAQRARAVAGERAARALERLLLTDEEVADSVVALLLSDATRGAFLVANSPTISELQSTGKLRVLRDEELRDALLTYYALIPRFQFSLETVVRRGRDPLGELGWDIRAYDDVLAYAANFGTVPSELLPFAQVRPARDGRLVDRFRAHPDARRATHRAITYNALMQPVLLDWELRLGEVRAALERE